MNNKRLVSIFMSATFGLSLIGSLGNYNRVVAFPPVVNGRYSLPIGYVSSGEEVEYLRRVRSGDIGNNQINGHNYFSNNLGVNVPLIVLAAENGWLALANELLINHNVDVVSTNAGEHLNALMASADSGNIEMMNLLHFYHGNNIDQNVNDVTTGYSALTEAIEGGGTPEDKLRMVELLIQWGADVNLDPGDHSPIACAAESGLGDVVRILLENGANPNGAKASESALEFAYSDGYEDTMRMLLDAGASIPDGLLAKAIVWEEDSMIQLLRQYGATVTYEQIQYVRQKRNDLENLFREMGMIG